MGLATAQTRHLGQTKSSGNIPFPRGVGRTILLIALYVLLSSGYILRLTFFLSLLNMSILI